MTEKEKKEYINKDILKFKSKLGEMPLTRKEADIYFQNFIEIASDWLERYKNNSMLEYATKVCLAFGDEVELQYRQRFLNN